MDMYSLYSSTYVNTHTHTRHIAERRIYAFCGMAVCGIHIKLTNEYSAKAFDQHPHLSCALNDFHSKQIGCSLHGYRPISLLSHLCTSRCAFVEHRPHALLLLLRQNRINPFNSRGRRQSIHSRRFQPHQQQNDSKFTLYRMRAQRIFRK